MDQILETIVDNVAESDAWVLNVFLGKVV